MNHAGALARATDGCRMGPLPTCLTHASPARPVLRPEIGVAERHYRPERRWRRSGEAEVRDLAHVQRTVHLIRRASDRADIEEAVADEEPAESRRLEADVEVRLGHGRELIALERA